VKKDIISKEITAELIKNIAIYILNIEVEEIELLNQEFERVESRRTDILAKINNSSILHIEYQNNNDKNMHFRMLRYFLDITTKYKTPPKQFVIYIGKQKLSMKNSIDYENLKFSYEIIDMKQIDCNLLLNQNSPKAWILAILCDFKDKKEDVVVETIIKKLVEYSKDDSQTLRNNLIMLEVLSENRDLEEIVKEKEEMFVVEVERLPSYRLGVENGETKNSFKIAQKLFPLLSIKEISETTGISVEELKKLKQQIYVLGEKNVNEK